MTDMTMDVRVAGFAGDVRTAGFAGAPGGVGEAGGSGSAVARDRMAEAGLMSVARLYFALEAARQTDQPLIVQFAGPTGGEGVSTIASRFARLAAREAPGAVLYLDCTPHLDRGPASVAAIGLLDAMRAGRAVEHAGVSVQGPAAAAETPHLRWARLGADDAAGPDPRVLAALASELRRAYSLVVLDCPPLNATPLSGFLSRLADGTILVAAAGVTRRGALQRAANEIGRFGGQVVGVVMNRQQHWLPAWLRRRFA